MGSDETARSAGDAGTDDAARPAFYALRSGGWRDYWTLLHPPYTLWHLSNVAFGAAAAPEVDGFRLATSLVAFFLGVGLTAHALDELRGRPLQTKIPSAALWGIAVVALVAAVALGVFAAADVSPWLLAFVAFGGFIVLAYNLELFGGRFHGDVWFALAWGGFPALTGYFAQAGTIGWPAVAVAAGCSLFAASQRTLSTPVRRLRRSVARVEGRMVLKDGTEARVTSSMLRAAPEGALRLLAAAMTLTSAGVVTVRLL